MGWGYLCSGSVGGSSCPGHSPPQLLPESDTGGAGRAHPMVGPDPGLGMRRHLAKDVLGSFVGSVDRNLGSQPRPQGRSHFWRNWKADQVCSRGPPSFVPLSGGCAFPDKGPGPPSHSPWGNEAGLSLQAPRNFLPTCNPALLWPAHLFDSIRFLG